VNLGVKDIIFIGSIGPKNRRGIQRWFSVAGRGGTGKRPDRAISERNLALKLDRKRQDGVEGARHQGSTARKSEGAQKKEDSEEVYNPVPN